jgi:hypothetical protein
VEAEGKYEEMIREQKMEATSEPPAQYYEKSEFIETHTGNKVGRKSILCGSQNIRLHGKVLRNADLE